MRRQTFDLDALRAFALGVELGSFARAAGRLARSTSAVSAQLKKLQRQAGAPLLRKAGRGTALTEAGETLLAYARRLLELNDEAAAALRGVALEGWVRLGLPEDFGESLLPAALGRFGRAHPKVRIEARIGRNADLRARMAAGQLDLALVWDDGPVPPHAERLGELPLCWIGTAGAPPPVPAAQEPLPLIAFEPPCLMRSLATAALDRAGRPWRLAFTSPSLAGLWAATAAGLGVTVRTRAGLPSGLRPLDHGEQGLPALPALGLLLVRGEATPPPAVAQLAALLREPLRAQLDAAGADAPRTRARAA
ncbi:LysR substrate-binding domain-containing protein [Fulvimonas soli]|jgi:DNA-binding transcriptional LysR family regulator|uniref:DNA-binding transcriptional LysR family regulator n=1 Tax=Fulvimonas soli TaxID=155197 RepID=A0A316IGP1_9GAMM|nr:LysR substrate-binding domain-containing protein [Fulvimonas soli]PWK92481.1 DNA-binding transcriptional LysR family regulator [Fulvimonas soli]TNY27152.1 LysR family transcriptional regulator [Fulvimonas soli]